MYVPVATQAPTASSFNALSIIPKILIVILGTVLIAAAVYVLYRVVTANVSTSTATSASSTTSDTTAPSMPPISSTSSVDQAPMAVDGASGTVIPAANVPLNSGSDYGLQFWMYIKDWDYQFGKAKPVIMRTDSTNTMIMNPSVSLHPTDNSLDVNISIFGNSSTSAGRSNAAPANSAGASGDLFTVTIENVPLQSWFAVSITCFQRNVDIYINGKLVRSAVLPGVARPAVGDITIGANDGFSGSVCTVKSKPGPLTPSEAAAFYTAGTPCSSVVQSTSSNDNTGTNTASSATLFGYKINFGITDSSGKTVAGFST
jgi:hypothetical protein